MHITRTKGPDSFQSILDAQGIDHENWASGRIATDRNITIFLMRMPFVAANIGIRQKYGFNLSNRDTMALAFGLIASVPLETR